MEQPNMMGNGIAPQNMMMSSMQRPQSGNIEQQIHAKIMDNLRQKLPTMPQGGWQVTFDIAQRATRILQLVSGLRMLHQETLKCLQIAENFEERTFQESPNKEIYFDKMTKKMAEIHQRRQLAANAAMQSNQIPMPMGNVMGMPQNGMGNMNNMQNLGLGNGMNMNMNMNNMGMGMNINGMGNNGMGMAMANQMGGNAQQNPNFPAQLQRQMQPSPIPQRNQQPPNTTLDPAALQNPQMQNQMMRQQMMNQNMQQQASKPNQPPNMSGSAPTGGGGGGDFVNHAKRIYDSMSEEKKNQMRAHFMSSLNDQQKAAMTKDGDPLFKFLVLKTREQKQRQAQMNQQNGANMQMGNNNNNNNNTMMGVNANNAQQTPASQSGAQNNFDFSTIMGQQQNAIKSQESGEQVVPASNNNVGLGQMNVSQGVNPQQLLANQNSQGGNNNNQMQFLAVQQRMAQQRQMALQNQMQQQGIGSQQGQHPNQNQLHGQRGGLNTPNALNGGQVNSPAMNMNMLNRPMAPPGQTTPSTPQPNRPQMPQTPANPANQLAQHHQSMISHNNAQMNQGGQGPTPQQQQLMMASLPEPLRQKLAGLAPEQMRQVLQRIRENPNQYAAIAQGMQNSGAGVMQQGMGGPQVGNQQQMMQGMPPNMSNAVPAFNSQPPTNQNQQQQGPNNIQANHIQKMQQQQAQAMRQRAMDLGEFAKPVPQNLGIQIPPEARTWGDIKRHIQENQAVMPPNLLEKLHTFQQQWYTAHPEDFRQAMTQLQAQMRGQHMQAQQGQPQMPPSARPPSAQPAPNGQAPPAQMVAPNAQMQQQGNQNGSVLNVNQMQLKPPPPEQIQMFRQTMPNAANMTDVEIRNALMRRRQQDLAANQQQMQLLQQAANMRRAQALANGGQPTAPDANLHQQQQQQQQQQQRPTSQQPQQPPNQQMNMQGQKRQQSGSDDLMEIPNPNQQPSMSNAQRQGASQIPQPFKVPTRSELEKMDPAQRSVIMQRMRQLGQLDALRKAQGGLVNPPGAPAQQQPQAQLQHPGSAQQKQPGQPQSGPAVTAPEIQALEKKVKALWEEVKRTTPKGPPITLDSDGLAQVQVSLKRLWTAVKNLDRTFYPALRAQQVGEERVKQAMRARIIVEQNSADSEGTTKDYLSVSPTELKKLEIFIGQYFTALKDLKTRQDAARAAAAGANPAQQQAAPTAAQPAKPQPPAAPQRKPSHSQVRKQSSANKAPPAPTDNTKTFDWGGAQSPQGVPKYENTRSELTADKLKLPPQKKRRTGGQAESAESTPAAAISTPQATGVSPSVTGTKVQAPGQPTKLQPLAKVEAPKFKCDDVLCEYSVQGFETQEHLKQHKDIMHQPVEDALQFLQDALSVSEKNIQAENAAITQKAAPQPRGKPMPAAVMKKEGLTPDVKTEALTPRPGSSLGKLNGKATLTPGKKAADAKTSDPVVEAPEKEKTLLESMAAKVGFELPACQPPRTSTPPPSEAFENYMFEDLMMNAGLANDTNWMDFTTDLREAEWNWGPEMESSPELTPSDGTSQSSKESDISQSERLRINFEWDAFRNGDTAVPDGLLQSLDLGLGGDTAMTEADGKEAKKDEQFNWSDDMSSWDALFGPNAGLEDEPVGMVF